MLEIKIIKDDKYYSLDLLPDTKLSFNFNSGIWNFNEILGSYSLPFNIPLSPSNLSILDFPSNIKYIRDNEEYQYDCAIYVNNLFFKSGLIEIQTANNNQAKATLFFGISTIYKFKDATLPELDIFGGEKDFEWKSEYNYNNSEFALPEIIDNDFLKGSLFDGRNARINQYDTVNEQYEIMNDTSFKDEHYPIIPMPFLSKVLKYIYNSMALTVNFDFFRQNSIRKDIVIFNINDLTKGEYDNDSDKFHYYRDYFKYNLKNHLPEYTIGELFTALHNLFCIDFNIINNTISIKSIKNYLIDKTYIDLSNYAEREISINYLKTQKGIVLKWDFDNDTLLNCSQVEEQFSADRYFITYQNMPQGDIKYNSVCIHDIGDQYMEFFLYRTYLEQISQKIFTSWKYSSFFSNDNHEYSFWLQNYFSDKHNEKIISMNISPFFTISYAFGNGYNTPRIIQAGNTWLNQDNVNEFKLRLAYSHPQNSQGKPYISHITTNSYHLTFWGSKGIFNTYWKEVANYLSSIDKEITIKFILSFEKILFFDFSKKIKVNNNLFFAKNMKYSIDINGNISPVEITLIQTY